MRKRAAAASIMAAPLCECGCGEPVSIVCGKLRRFVYQHHARSHASTHYVVDPETGCWVWQLTKTKGYGYVRVDGRSSRAHRVYYERFKGQIPEGMQLDHLCGNRSCVNPEHLEPVTNAENGRRGRATKLAVEQVREIRSSTEGARVLAARFGISPSHVDNIRAGRYWKDVA